MRILWALNSIQNEEVVRRGFRVIFLDPFLLYLDLTRLIYTLPPGAVPRQVIELHSKLFVQGNPVTVKYALARLGKICDMLRVPLVPMEDQYREVVDQALDSAGLLSMSRV